ncbi:MAG: hypothetical protein MJ204_05460 [Bacteroidales bacterium]|nr:hypothetical protein [Bacteroidales bacterium]
MKQFRLFLIGALAFTSLFVTTSCEKQYVTKEYYVTEEHHTHNEYGAQMYTTNYLIKGTDWKVGYYDDGRKYLYAECDNADITDNVMRNGVVLAYFWFTYKAETNSSSWNLLPYVYPYLYENDEGKTVAVGENIRYEYENGTVTFIIEDLDGFQPDAMEINSEFKVVVLENAK